MKQNNIIRFVKVALVTAVLAVLPFLFYFSTKFFRKNLMFIGISIIAYEIIILLSASRKYLYYFVLLVPLIVAIIAGLSFMPWHPSKAQISNYEKVVIFSSLISIISHILDITSKPTNTK